MILKRADIVLFFFVLNVVVSLTAGYFTSPFLNIGVARAGLMLITIPLLLVDGARLTWGGLMIFACLGYLAILTPFSSSPIGTADTVLKVAISLMMFVLAYNYLRGEEARRRLALLVPVCLLLFVVNFIIAQVFGIGVNPYYEEGLSAGAGNIQQTYLIAYLLIFFPMLGFFRNVPFRIRWWEAGVLLLSLFPLVLIGRRGAILGFLVGLLIYAVLTPRKGRVVGLGIAAVLVALLTFPLYIDHVQGVLAHRMEQTDTPDSIGRVQELINCAKTIRDGSMTTVLFGKELFNYIVVTRDFRDLHTDYAAYLLGGGLVGFFLYFSIVPALWLDFVRRIRVIRDAYVMREVTAVFLGLAAAFFIISFSGQYYVVSSLSIVFILWGAILAYMEELKTVEPEHEKVDCVHC